MNYSLCVFSKQKRSPTATSNIHLISFYKSEITNS